MFNPMYSLSKYWAPTLCQAPECKDDKGRHHPCLLESEASWGGGRLAPETCEWSRAVRALSGHGRRQRPPWVLRPEGIQCRKLLLLPSRSRTSSKEMLKPEKKHMKWLESGEGDQCSGLQRKTRLLLLWPLMRVAVSQWAGQRREQGHWGWSQVLLLLE